MNDNENLLSGLSDYFETFNDVMSKIEKESEEKWNALSKEDQLDYFCAVVRRIHKGEIAEKHSYRGVLYGVFGFGPEAYAQAQMSGYLDLHNSIYTHEYERDLLSAYTKKMHPDMSEEEIEKHVRNFTVW